MTSSEWRRKMPWVLVFLVASLSGANVAPVTVPMASEKLCKEALEKLKGMYQQTESTHYAVTGECLQVK
jgi:hypothetical protein